MPKPRLNIHENYPNLGECLAAYVSIESQLSIEVLDRWVDKNPEYTQALIGFTLAWTIYGVLASDMIADLDTPVDETEEYAKYVKKLQLVVESILQYSKYTKLGPDTAPRMHAQVRTVQSVEELEKAILQLLHDKYRGTQGAPMSVYRGPVAQPEPVNASISEYNDPRWWVIGPASQFMSAEVEQKLRTEIENHNAMMSEDKRATFIAQLRAEFIAQASYRQKLNPQLVKDIREAQSIGQLMNLAAILDYTPKDALVLVLASLGFELNEADKALPDDRAWSDHQ